MALNAYQQSFPFSSEFAKFEDWNGNFLIWFGEQPIPYNMEERWEETATAIAALPFFEVYPIPYPQTFETWQDWADEVAELINGASMPSTNNNPVVIVPWINSFGVQVGWINNSSNIVNWTS